MGIGRPCAAVALSLAALVAPAGAMAQDPLPVSVIRAEPRPDIRSISIVGEIVARTTVTTGFPAGGRVVEVMVEEGDRVETGMVLARIESVQQQQALRAARAFLDSARASNRQAEDDFARAEALLASGTATRAARDAAEQQFQASAGTLVQAEAELDRAARALADTELVARAAAVVTRRMIDPGQVVGAAQPVIELSLDTGFDAVFGVPEVVLTGDQPAGAIRLNRISHPDEVFGGEVREVSPIVSPGTGTVTVKVSVDDPPAGLGYGEAVRGTAEFGAEPVIALPWSAMTATAMGPAVWRVDPTGSVAELRQVSIARHESGRVILAGGVEAGDIIVVQGGQFLSPGRPVRIAEVAP